MKIEVPITDSSGNNSLNDSSGTGGSPPSFDFAGFQRSKSFMYPSVRQTYSNENSSPTAKIQERTGMSAEQVRSMMAMQAPSEEENVDSISPNARKKIQAIN